MVRMLLGRLWRPLIGVTVAYAVAAQGLLIAVGGFSFPAVASDGAAAFDLCMHHTQGAPELPIDNGRHSQCADCPFCFAGTQDAVVAGPSAVFTRLFFEAAEIAWADNKHSLHGLRPYFIASPRGPPFEA
jgi:hypothetical protein